MIRLWSIISIYLKFGFFIFSSHALSKSDKSIDDIYRYLGMKQSHIAIQFQANQYGITAKTKLFNSLLEQLSLFGYGIGKLESQTADHIKLRFDEVGILWQCRQYMDQFRDPYLEGILIGMANIFADRVSSITIQTENSDCLKVHMQLDGAADIGADISNAVSKEIKAIISERMKHKYYLSPD